MVIGMNVSRIKKSEQVRRCLPGALDDTSLILRYLRRLIGYRAVPVWRLANARSHRHNLRQRPLYQRQRVVFAKTRPVVSTIGIRRKLDPQGRPGPSAGENDGFAPDL